MTDWRNAAAMVRAAGYVHPAEVIEEHADVIADLTAALSEVMEWIGNWNPDFERDPEWPETRDKARAAIARARAGSATPDPVPDDDGSDCLRGTLGT